MSLDPRSPSFPTAPELATDAHMLREHAVDDIQPKVVAYPRRPADVADLLGRANAQEHKVVPWGSGTKQSIGAPPERVDLVLKLELLNRIADHDHQNMTVTVEAGARLAAVQAALRERSQLLPLDPPFGHDATIGGILATNSSGPRRLLYGSARDFVLGMKTALPNGTIVKAGGKTVKNVAGFDLSKLHIGAMGTLGVIVEATFRVLPLPETSATRLFLFSDLDAPCAAVTHMLGSALLPAAVELLNPAAMARCRTFTGSAKKMWCLAVACEGFAESVARHERDVAATCSGATAVRLAGAEQDAFWRFVTDHLSDAGTRKPLYTVRSRISLPLSQVKTFVCDAQRRLDEAGIAGAITAHAATGIVYVLCPDAAGAQLPALRKRANELGGWLAVEAAPVALKRQVGVWDAPPGGLQIMKRLRSAFDPKRTLNPGRFVDGL